MRLDCYRARVVDGLGQIIHERLFVVEINENARPALRDPTILGNSTLRHVQEQVSHLSLSCRKPLRGQRHALLPFLNDVRAERLAEVDRIGAHIELSLTELLQKADDEIARAATEVELKARGCSREGSPRRRSVTQSCLNGEKGGGKSWLANDCDLQAVERITGVVILPHPERARRSRRSR